MRTDLYSSAGIYSPTFLNMRINTSESVEDIFSLTEQTSAAFIHEYVHFLQDLTTVYGLRNIIMVVDYIKTVNIDQRESKSRIMKIPYQIDKAKIRGSKYNGSILKTVTGTVSNISDSPIEKITKTTEQKELPPLMVDIEIIEIHLQNRNCTYRMGSHAILESMAYLIEQSLYPNILPESADFCYHAAERVGSFVYSQFAENKINLIALCDVSLMYCNPGLIFYIMLETMKEEKFHPASYMEIYEFVFVRAHQSYGQLEHWDYIFNNHTLTAISQLNDYFTIDKFERNKAWIDFTLRNANTLRNSDVSFFTKLASEGSIASNPTFKKTFAALGMPMVNNIDGKAWFATNVPNQASVRPEILWVINQIYNIYVNSNSSVFKRCTLEKWCSETCSSNGIDDYTDQRCYDNPWDRFKDAKELCTFSQVWRAWGMESENPTHS